MTEETSSLILEMLRAMRGKIDQMADDIGSIKLRQTSIEHQVAGLHKTFADLHADNAVIHGRIDGVDKRLERIERRLELTPA